MGIFSRKFGCEFELATEFDIIATYIKKFIPIIYGAKNYHIRRSRYNSRHDIKWSLKLDSSSECELVTPISTFSDLKNICRLIDSLKKRKVKADENNAVHVHVDARDISVNQLLSAWLYLEPVILKCFPYYRQSNSYCERLFTKKQKDILANCFTEALSASLDHHAVFSFFHFSKRKTVEFRICEGTLDIKLISNFIRLCMYFLHYAKHADPIKLLCLSPIQSVGSLQTILKLPASLSDYWQRRYMAFYNKKG